MGIALRAQQMKPNMQNPKPDPKPSTLSFSCILPPEHVLLTRTILTLHQNFKEKGELGGLVRSSRNCCSEPPRLCCA